MPEVAYDQASAINSSWDVFLGLVIWLPLVSSLSSEHQAMSVLKITWMACKKCIDIVIHFDNFNW